MTDNPSSNFLLQFCDVFSNLIASIFSFAHYKHVHGNTAFHERKDSFLFPLSSSLAVQFLSNLNAKA
jgi:hypothetical protein